MEKAAGQAGGPAEASGGLRAWRRLQQAHPSQRPGFLV